MRWRKRDKKPSETSRIDRALFPVFGPAQIGPYDEPDRDYVPVDLECSICYRPMSTHITDRSGGRSRIMCPPLTSDDVRALPPGR